MPVLGKEKTYILQVQNIEQEDASLVGEAGLRFAALEKLSVKTPPAFVITTLAFDDFLTASNIVDDILVSLAKVVIGDWNSSVAASQEIHDMLIGVDFPSLFLNPLLHALNALTGGKSSYIRLQPSWVLGNNEYATSLSLDKYNQNYLASEEQILVGIKECWASLFSAEAIYERSQARYSGALSAAVVVQKILPAEVSGTSFSKDPLSDSSFNLVKAIYGMSYSNGFVEDATQPDIYRIDPADHRITEKTFSAQTQMRLLKGRVADEPELIVPVSPQWQSRQKLDDRHVIELSELTTKLSKQFGDVEIDFALQGGKLYITGMRKETDTEIEPEVEDSPEPEIEIVEKPKVEEIDFNKLVAEVDTLTAEVKATLENPSEEKIGRENIERLPLKLPRTVAKLYLNISSGDPEQIQYASEFDSVKVTMPSLLKQAHLTQFTSLKTEEESSHAVSALSSEIGVAAKISPNSAVLIDFSDSDSINSLTDGLANQYLSHPNWFSLEYIAIKKAHRDFDLGRFELVLPIVRNYQQLIELRKQLGLNGFRHSNTRMLGINVALPVSEYVLKQIEESDIDFIYVPLNQLSIGLFGHDQLSLDDYSLLLNRVEYLSSLARQKKLQIYIDIGLHTAVLKDVMNLLPETVVFGKVPETDELKMLSELSQTQSAPLKKRGRRIKQI